MPSVTLLPEASATEPSLAEITPLLLTCGPIRAAMPPGATWMLPALLTCPAALLP